MSGPSVVVERAPDGWTHIGGPGMHLLIGLDEDDERTLSASDAADGGDLDDVVEVLTAGGVRKAHHFVGVHWEPRTRIVAFGPVSALVTLADGSEHDVRAPSARVWTDLELPEPPERVVLRVLEESERSQPVPPQHLLAGLPAASTAGAAAPDGVMPSAGADDSDGRADPSETTRQADSPNGGSSAPAIPTFGAVAASDSAASPAASASSPWGRSWARRDETPAPPVASEPAAQSLSAPAAPAADAPGTAAPQTNPSSAPSAPALRSWGSVSPAVPVRAAGRPAPPVVVEPATPVVVPPPVAATPVAAPVPDPPVAVGLPPEPPRDVDSTWAARPLPEAHPAAADTDAEQVAAPSYDYLFGHTTAADEHRKVLAQLTQPADDEGAHEDDEVLSVPAFADTSDASVTNAAPAPQVPERAIPSAPEVPEGGLISSVPWATPSSTPAPEPEAETPTFSGRHTPPAAPSLLPPVNTPPPGARAPEATPLISTGPPPSGQHAPEPVRPRTSLPEPNQPEPNQPEPNQPEPNQPERWAVPHATPVLRTPPTVPIATTPPPQPALPQSPPAAQAVAGDETELDDETELTVDRSALLEARNAAQSQAFSGPSVLAVLCSSGHPTPPHSDRCRVCGSGIPPQEPFTMPRPPLGVLRLSTGDVVTLDRSVLLGRAPRPGDGLAAHDRPHVVKVPSPERDVSRNHVEVILEGWHVLIRDLGTTNGTTVTLPGEAPVRLRANDQQVLEPGSLVSMADEVSFTFEAAS